MAQDDVLFGFALACGVDVPPAAGGAELDLLFRQTGFGIRLNDLQGLPAGDEILILCFHGGILLYILAIRFLVPTGLSDCPL